MNKKRKRILIITVSILCVVTLFFFVKLLSEFPYKSKLPDLPDLSTGPIPLKEQILDADSKAHSKPSSDNLGALGMVYHSNAYYDNAAQCYSLAIKKNFSGWIWSYYLGYLHMEMGESETGIENFRSVIKVNPEAYHAWYHVGEGYQNLGEWYKAEVAFNKIANLMEGRSMEKSATRNDYFPLRVYAMYQLGRIYMNTNRNELAEKTLIEIIKFHRSFGPAYRLLGNLNTAKGDSLSGSYYIVRANDLSNYAAPVDTLVDKLANISRTELYLLKQIDEAERSIYPEWALELAKKALNNIPDNKYLISRTVKLLLKLDHGKEALTYLNKHLILFKDDFNEINEVAEILAEKGLYYQAMIYFNQATKLNPEDADARLGLTSCLWNTGMKQIAVSQIDTLLNKNKNDEKVLTEGVYHLIMLGEKEKAVSYLSVLKRISPSGPGIQKLQGLLAEQEGKLIEATRLYESALKQNPEDLLTVKHLGTMLIKQNLWEIAINHFKKALKYFPNEPYLLERIGTLLVSCPELNLRNYSDGKDFSERAFIHKGCPTDILISAGRSLSEAYSGLGDKPNALTFFNITLNLARNEQLAPEIIADLEAELKKLNTTN